MSSPGQARLLLVEDEALIRMMLVEMVEELGHIVVAEAGSVPHALPLAESTEYDLAMLDINLAGVLSEPVAAAVAARGKPIIFVSGYGSDGAPAAFREVPILTKPVSQLELKQTVDRVLGAYGSASR